MRVAIIGGTGFVGGYLIDALLQAGHEPSVLVRPGSEEKLEQPEACRIVSGTVDSDSAINEALNESGAVIFNVGILRAIPSKGITFEALQHDAALKVLTAAKRAGVSRFLLMSANGARVGGTPYQDTKARAEEAVLASGLDATVFRPSVIFGDPRGASEIATQLYRQMIKPPLPAIGFQTGWLPGAGSVQMSPVHVADVAAAMVSSLEDPDTYGKTYVLGGPEAMSWSEMLAVIAAAVGRKKLIIPMPIGLMRIPATLLDWLPFFPVTRDQLTMLAEGNSASPDELAALLGREPLAFAKENLAYLRNAA